MATLLTLILFFAIFWMLLDIVLRLQPMPIGRALPIAFACLVALESVILNGLSLFQAATAIWILGLHILLLLMWFIAVTVKGKLSTVLLHLRKLRHLLCILWHEPAIKLMVPLILLLGFTALIYPPNTDDSMTYHMSRVAYWMQNKSIDIYPTAEGRQNAMTPGAEYIILFLQMISGSDYLANGVQWFAYIVLLMSSFYLARMVNIPKKFRGYTVIICSTTPMALMQATSTQNDLAASVMTYAIIFSTARLLWGRWNKMSTHEYILSGISVGSAFLVKPTALLVGLPVVAVGLLFQNKDTIKNGKILISITIGSLIAVMMILIVAGPDYMRRVAGNKKRPEVYPLFSQWNAERFWNPVRTMGVNAPFPKQTRKLLKTLGVSGPIYTGRVFEPHEDLIGNPVQMLIVFSGGLFAVILGSVLIFKRNYRRPIILSMAPVFSWLVFSLMVKNQQWISRLQLPIFYLIPLSLSAITVFSVDKKLFRSLFYVSIAALSFLSISYAYVAAANNRSRPLRLHHFFGSTPQRETAYYNNRNMKASHDYLLDTANKIDCSRIGLILEGANYDYPLSWRAMRDGREVRHLLEDDTGDWPCVIYAEYRTVVRLLQTKRQFWKSAGRDVKTFIRDLPTAFKYARNDCLLLSPDNSFAGVVAGNDVSLNPGKSRLLAEVHGNDPFIFLPVSEFEGRDRDSAIIRIDIYNPMDTTFQLFYSQNANSIYSESKSIKRFVAKGRNEVFFELNNIPENLNSPLRLDLGSEPGIFYLYAIDTCLL